MKWSSRQVRGKYRPSKRSAHSSVVVDGSKLFMFGGWDGQQELGDLMVFDTGTYCDSISFLYTVIFFVMGRDLYIHFT